jgi:zinc protease
MKITKILTGIMIGLGLFFAWQMIHPQQPEGKKQMKNFRLVREAGGIREYELIKNGLRVLTFEDHSAPVATVMVSYLVGTRNEREGNTGGSHMLEHMMFKGTEKYNRKSGNSMFSLLQQAGALMNATTGMDVTEYFETLPSERIPLALELEADRMRNAQLRAEDFEVERDVVLNELERMDNSPISQLMKGVWKTAYEKHPYRNLAIGLREDLHAMTVEKLKAFYNRYYWPDNAVLIAAGDFNTEELLSQVDRYFGDISRSPGFAVQPPLEEPVQKTRRTVSVECADKLDAVLLASKSPQGRDPDALALEVVAQILAGGKNSRLYRSLVDEKLAAQVSSSPSAYRDPGLFGVLVILNSGVKHEEVEKKILAEYRKIQDKGVSTEELERVKRQMLAQAVYSWDGTQGVVDGLSGMDAAGDWTLFPKYRDLIQKISSEDIRQAAKKYLDESSLTAGYLVSKPLQHPTGTSALGEVPHQREEAGGGGAQVVLGQKESSAHESKIADRVQIRETDGIKILALKTSIRDVISLSGSIYGAGHAFSKNPVLASITASMLDLGTKQHDKFAIAKILEGRGVELSFETGPTRVGFHARLLKENLEETVRLIAEQLRFPAFREDELEKVKQQVLVSIEHQMTDTGSAASLKLSQLIYPPAHPSYEVSFADQMAAVKETSAEDIRKFHDDHYGKNSFLITAVGDVDIENLANLFRKAFEGWPPRDVKPDFTTKVTAVKPQRQMIAIQGKGNLDVCFGQGVPITRRNPEYPALTLAAFALGGDFSSRLNSTVRDTYGLSYFIYSKMEGVTGDIEGHWLIHMITLPSLVEAARERTFSEIKKFVSQGMTAEELKRNQNSISGQFKVNLATTGAMAEQIRRVEEIGLGVHYIDEFPEMIRNLKVDDVNRVIAKYMHPDELNLVIAGDDNAGDQA